MAMPDGIGARFAGIYAAPARSAGTIGQQHLPCLPCHTIYPQVAAYVHITIHIKFLGGTGSTNAYVLGAAKTCYQHSAKHKKGFFHNHHLVRNPAVSKKRIY